MKDLANDWTNIRKIQCAVRLGSRTSTVNARCAKISFQFTHTKPFRKQLASPIKQCFVAFWKRKQLASPEKYDLADDSRDHSVDDLNDKLVDDVGDDLVDDVVGDLEDALVMVW